MAFYEIKTEDELKHSMDFWKSIGARTRKMVTATGFMLMVSV